MRMPYPEARIFLHPALTRAQVQRVCEVNGLEVIEGGRPSLEQKRIRAIAYLRSRNLYILDRGSKVPSWAQGHKDDPEAA